MKLYRAMSEAEFQDLCQTGRFRSISSSLDGKWLAESAGDARRWGREFGRISAIPHDRIVEIDVGDDVADSMFRVAFLDGIGPARFATIEELAAARFREVTQ